ncbi:MAG: hypothetical protein AB1545_14150 [Thermodesulfobacteriota bacterium]
MIQRSIPSGSGAGECDHAGKMTACLDIAKGLARQARPPCDGPE